MPIPNLDDLTDQLDATVSAYLDELISYQLPPAAAVDLRADVNYREHQRDLGGVAAMEQDMMVRLRTSLVAEKPNSNVRIQLTKRPGKTYKPANVGLDDSGTHYEFELAEVVDA